MKGRWISLRRAGFDPRLVRVGFVVNKVEMAQFVFVSVLRFLLMLSLQKCSMLIIYPSPKICKHSSCQCR